MSDHAVMPVDHLRLDGAETWREALGEMDGQTIRYVQYRDWSPFPDAGERDAIVLGFHDGSFLMVEVEGTKASWNVPTGELKPLP